MKQIPRLHPGEILKIMYLEPLNLTVTKLAETIKKDRSGVSELINGKRSITADTALRLSIAFDTTAQYWMNLQSTFDLWRAEKNKRPKIKALVTA
jgi:addiction module HigA family antidote